MFVAGKPGRAVAGASVSSAESSSIRGAWFVAAVVNETGYDRRMQPEARQSVVEEVDRHGFAVLDEYLPRATVENLLAATRLTNNTNPTDPSIRHKRGVAFARRNLLQCPTVSTFAGSPLVRDLLAGFCPDCVPVRAILFDKTGDANWTVPWHQDRSIAVRERRNVPGFGPWSTKAGVVHVQPPPKVLRTLITLRFSLDACGTDNGALRVIPDTHLTLLEPSRIEMLVASRTQVNCTTLAGGLVIMRPLLLHASSPATQPAHRRVLHIEFGPPALPGDLRWAFSPEDAGEGEPNAKCEPAI